VKRTLTSQGKPFTFSFQNQKKAAEILARYPATRQASAILPLLDLAQRQAEGWLPQEAIEHVAELLKISSIRAYEIATFYTMFNLSPRGKYLLQVCTTTPCQLGGSDEILKTCNKMTDVDQGKTSEDGLFTVLEVECLGACVNAPVVQINDDYFEDLNAERMLTILNDLKLGKHVKPGSTIGRQCSAPYNDSHQEKEEA
jgi:NADH-quinone oxidoreductase E subunit